MEEGNSVVPATPSLRPSAERKRLRRGCYGIRSTALRTGSEAVPLSKAHSLADSSCFRNGVGVRPISISGVRFGAPGFGDLAGEEAQGEVGGFGEPYAWGGLDVGVVSAVVDDLDGGVGCGQVEVVGVFAGDVEGLAEAAGASGEEFGFGIGCKASEVGHGLDAVDGGDGADEYSASLAGEMGGGVEAVVHAVDEVDVGAAGWAEEGEVIGGEAAIGVRGGVGEAEVGLDLGDAAGEALAVEIADEEFAEESSGDDFGGAGVEGFWEESRVAGFWVCAHILG